MNEIQQKEVEILIAIKKVLEKHHLIYYAIGGTCIGAVRHKGFIPWDDDIDIAMPRKDYEDFRLKYYKELPEYYKKLDCDNSKGNVFLFTKIYDSRTTYVENYAKNRPDRFTGVFVDIMPVDGLPNDEKKRKKRIAYIDRMSHFNCLNRPWPHKNQNFIEVCKYFGKRIIQITHPFNYYSTKVLKAAISDEYENSDYIFFTWRYKSKIERKMYKSSLFRKTIEVPFENTTIRVPAEYDKYLTQDFGDYMKLPPEEEQRTVHSVYICDMHKPCSYYARLEERKLK